MPQPLTDTIAIVVGASSGMGRATAKTLAAAGATVIAAARRDAALQDLASEVTAAGGRLEAVRADTTVRSDVENLIEQTVDKEGRIDLLVYATGTNITDRSLEVLTPDTWEMMLATNLTGAFLCTRAVLPAMRAAGGGLIIYLSTGAVQMPDVSGVAYQASKHGLTGLAHGTRVEQKAHGIRTSIIFPGLCKTEILDKRPVPTPQEVLNEALEPQDVADAVLFVASLPPRAVVPELQLFPSRL